MKTIFIFIFASVGSMAEVASADCLQAIAIERNWQPLTDDQVTCISSMPEAVDGLKLLCNSSNSDLSTKYKKYLTYKAKYHAAFQAFQQATDIVSRNQAAIDMRTIQRDWSGAGFRAEIDAALNPVASAQSQCAQSN